MAYTYIKRGDTSLLTHNTEKHKHDTQQQCSAVAGGASLLAHSLLNPAS